MWLIIHLALCALAGWATGQIMKGSGYGLLGDLLLGIVGGWVGGFLLGGLVAGYGLFPIFLVRLLGAIVVVALVRFLKRA